MEVIIFNNEGISVTNKAEMDIKPVLNKDNTLSIRDVVKVSDVHHLKSLKRKNFDVQILTSDAQGFICTFVNEYMYEIVRQMTSDEYETNRKIIEQWLKTHP